jgi:hypothetical protein
MADSAAASNAANEYVHYLITREILRQRLGATPEEIAIWAWLGAESGGLDGYLDPRHFGVRYASARTGELQPPRFNFVDDGSDLDYRAQMMQCHFHRDQIDAFQPADRFLTYGAVLERWSDQLSDGEARALIASKARIGTLSSLHPVTGGTRGTPLWEDEEDFPSLEEGIFPETEVALIEAGCFPETIAGGTVGAVARVARGGAAWANWRELALRASSARSEKAAERLAPLWREFRATPEESGFAILKRLMDSGEAVEYGDAYRFPATNGTLKRASVDSWMSRARTKAAAKQTPK